MENFNSPQVLYPGDEKLPDISSVTFDHKDRKGNDVKFLWGVATSSYQVEGNIIKNDWEIFVNSKARRERVYELARIAKISINLESPDDALDHWDLEVFSEDLERARSLGMNSYRLSLEWSRIQPHKPKSLDDGTKYSLDDFDLDAVSHYRSMLDIIIKKGMTPILTLNHMTLPVWVLTPPTTLLDTADKGFRESLEGWESLDTVQAFARFVEFVAERFCDVKYWITINEPGSIMGLGYMAGVWSPGFLASHERAKSVLFNMIEAHARAYDVIKRVAGPDTKVGFANHMIFPRPKPDIEHLYINEQACAQFDYCFNKFFLEAVTDGIYNPDLLLDSHGKTVKENWKGRLDFVGVNYYRSAYIYKSQLLSIAAKWIGGIFDEDLNSDDHVHNLLNDLGWEIYPGGLYRILRYLDGRFGLPILITENGLAESSDEIPASGAPTGKRGPYIISHLSQVLHAIKEGVDIIGYMHWTIADNWEWDYDYLPKARFGLYTIDRSRTDSKAAQPLRIKTRGAEALEYIIGQGKIGDAVEKFGTISEDGSKVISQL